jgi:hypothetical protein
VKPDKEDRETYYLCCVVLEVIGRRANLQTTSTICNKEKQIFSQPFGMLSFEREAAKVGLKINEQKTKYMIAAW